MGKMVCECGALRERKRDENGGELWLETATISTFLLGGYGGAAIPLRSGEELARSGAARWVSGVVLDGLSERTGKRKGVLGFIRPGWCMVDQEQERKKGWGLASPLATGGGVDIAGSMGGGFGR
jgi:hypothetical protein